MNEAVFSYHIFFPIIFFFLSGCVKYNFSYTNDLELRPRPSDCKYRIFTSQPQVKFEEIGIITFGAVFPQTIADVKRQADRDVCASGANGLILWESNEAGRYIKATVIKYKK